MATAQNIYNDAYDALDSRINHLNVPATGGVAVIDHHAYNILEIDAAITCTLEDVNAIPVGVEVLVIAQASCTVESQALASGEHAVFKVTKDSSGDKQWVITSLPTSLTATSFLDDAELSFGTGNDAVLGWETGDADNHTYVIGLGDSNQALHITDKGAISTDWNVSADTHPTVYIHSNTTPATDYVSIGGHDGTTATIDVVGGTTLALAIAGTTVANLTASGIQLQDDDAVIFGTGSDASILFDGTKLIVSPLAAGGDVWIGDSSDTAGNKLYIYDGSTEQPAAIVLHDHAGTAYYLWVDNTGDLRIHTSYPTDEDADGTVVGAQS